MNFNKLIIFTNMPSPYQVELFNAIYKKKDLKVIYARKTLKNRKWNFERYIQHPHIFLSGNLKKRLSSVKDFVTHNTDSTLYIVSGYNLPEFVYIMKLLHAKNVPWVFWGEKIRLKNLSIKKMTILPLLKKSLAVLAIGEQAAAIYYEILNNPTFIFPYYIDTAKFKEPSYFHGGKINFIYSGQMVKRKGVHILKEAILFLGNKYKNKVQFHLIGEGKLLDTLKRDLKGLNNVEFYGFVGYEYLPSIYEVGDVFLFPSLYDGWGVALIEGMAAGMLPVSTFTTGAAVQNILNGINGYIIPPNNTSALLSILEHIVKNREIIPEMGKLAREYTLKHGDVRAGVKKLLSILQSI